MKIWEGRYSKAPLSEGKQITLGAERFNVLNHPNFAVPSNTQAVLIQGGNGEAVFKDVVGDFADNVGQDG